VLDFALPDGDGMTLCRQLRMTSNLVPVLMLTAHSGLATRVGSFEAGADDFLAKPFSIAELRARVRSLGRRRTSGSVPFNIVRGELRIDFAARRASHRDHAIDLTPREWVLLELLAARTGRLVSRGELLSSAWGEATAQNAASLEVLVGRIRRKLGTSAIRTVRGEGYALELAD
jgi:two-component system OmpR family response regulator